MKSFLQFIIESEVDETTYKDFRLEVHEASDLDFNIYMSEMTDAIWDLLQEAYSDKGGFFGIASKRDLKKKIKLVKTVYYKDQLVAAAIYNPYIPEYKCVGIGAVKSVLHRQGVVGVKIILRHDTVNWNNFTYIEADLDVEMICKEVGAFHLPGEFALELFKGNITLWKDGFHYNRYLKAINDEVTKSIFGVPNPDISEEIKERHSEYFSSILKNIENKHVEIDYSKFNESLRYGQLSTIDCAWNIIRAFNDNFYDRGVYEYSPELIDKLKENIETVRSEYERGNYDPKHEYLYPEIIEEGEELLKKLRPFKLHILNLSLDLKLD